MSLLSVTGSVKRPGIGPARVRPMKTEIPDCGAWSEHAQALPSIMWLHNTQSELTCWSNLSNDH